VDDRPSYLQVSVEMLAGDPLSISKWNLNDSETQAGD
jgi:hypothetical protein